MSRRKVKIARGITMIVPADADPDEVQQKFKRWRERQRFLIEHHPELARKARKLGILPRESNGAAEK